MDGVDRMLILASAINIKDECEEANSKGVFNKMKALIIMLVILTATSLSNAHAATFKIFCDSQVERASKSCAIKITGVIKKGDSAKLLRIIKTPVKKGWSYGDILLDSPGGDVSEAMEIAKLVRKYMLRTSTTHSRGDPERLESKRFYSCISSCFLVWVAGTERFSFNGYDQIEGQHYGIGLHRPYFPSHVYGYSPAKVSEIHKSINALIREYLQQEQVPDLFIEQMLERSSKEIYWAGNRGMEFSLNGRAPWFEEMMIARCGFDPAYDRESEWRISDQISRTGVSEHYTPDSITERYQHWRQKYNSCAHSIRLKAQIDD